MNDPKTSNAENAAAGQTRAGWRRFMSGGAGGKGSQRAFYENPKLAELARVFERSQVGWFWSVDQEMKLTYISPQVAEKLGTTQDQLLGKPFATLFRTDPIEGEAINRTLPFVLGKRGRFSDMVLRAAGQEVECWWSISGQPIEGRREHFRGYWGNALDVTASKRSDEESSRLTSSDSLTGLASRHKMSTSLQATLTAYRVAKRSCALMMIDLDRFKQVNDTLGHPAGDELLKQASQRLTRVVNKKCEIGRIGGDEFQVILPDIDDRGELGDVAKKIISIISQPYTIDGVRCVIGASIGVAIAPYDGIDSDELTRSADLALYAAKNDGRGRHRYYSSELHDQAESRRQIEDDLRDALARGEITLAYQPIVEAKTNLISGFEALMRWDHAERGPISPSIFIPIAEDANLIGGLGEWALRQACTDAAAWEGTARVSVNVSPVQFEHIGLPALVASALANSGLAAERLELEITESVFMGDVSDMEATFANLKNLGVRLALDDFGTGYSSLSYLKSAPFDKIKIDQSFVRDATLGGNRNAALISAIVSLAGALGMETTAEGVETLDTLELIRKLDVSHVQGYVYSRPIGNEEIVDRLASGDLEVNPTGRVFHRSDRKTLFRKIGLIYEDDRYEVTMRNLSKSGAFIEGLLEVPIGTDFVVDFGEGQLTVATVTRSVGNTQGLNFEVPLISDGSDGLCTRHRVSPYSLAAAGMPLAALPPGQYPLNSNGKVSNVAAKTFSLPTFVYSHGNDSNRRVA
jgi:diguanylate cyclase (GGDEF)-like protein/PAS domain S-box-containing protein